jgi:enterochelin esterase-like enzyme
LSAAGTASDATAPARRIFAVAAPALALVVFLAGGGLGTYRYLWNFWEYRGYAPPHDPAFVARVGTTESLHVASSALGGRRQEVVVYLPPGYRSNSTRRYPVLYLLHGFPGTPRAFLHELRMGVVDDVFTERGRGQPLILVMPFGSTGVFTDKEWVNGYRSHEAWETFLVRDVVRAVDSHYRTIRSGSGRAIAGLSEGGYAALNIGLHHPGEFHVLESWSGYERADPLRSIFATSPERLAWNSPFTLLPHVARALRRDHTYVWLYSGTTDRLRAENTDFAQLLSARHVSHRYFVANGGHEWALWRRYAPAAYLVAAEHLHG